MKLSGWLVTLIAGVVTTAFAVPVAASTLVTIVASGATVASAADPSAELTNALVTVDDMPTGAERDAGDGTRSEGSPVHVDGQRDPVAGGTAATARAR
ncbi:MAG TPA: hypothetical protein VHS03_05245 [Gaiellaceae bacterium]|nr:hypothetical protein [Gaiellaceae bacterium]